MNSYEIRMADSSVVILDADDWVEDKKAVSVRRNGKVIAKFYVGMQGGIVAINELDQSEPEPQENP
jgi:hypothetical protein